MVAEAVVVAAARSFELAVVMAMGGGDTDSIRKVVCGSNQWQLVAWSFQQ